MSTFDRQTEILNPTWDKISRRNYPVADPLILVPTSSSPLAIIDGEWMGLDSNGKLVRATAASTGFLAIEDRGDYGVQVHKRPAIVLGPSGYVAQTNVYDDGLVSAAFGTALKLGSFTAANSRLGGARLGLVAQGGSGIIIARVMKSPASLTGKMEFINILA